MSRSRAIDRIVMPSTAAVAQALRACVAGTALLGLAALAPLAAAAPAKLLPHSYDPARDAAADIDRAVSTAAATGRRVLLMFGGDWCKDCRELDALFAADPSLARLRDRHYVTVKVFVGNENRNERVLARYPRIDWLPTLIELDGKGRVRRVVPSTQFHDADRLVPARVRAFLAG
jgi:thiol:disulfide interchange protein